MTTVVAVAVNFVMVRVILMVLVVLVVRVFVMKDPVVTKSFCY